MIKSDLRRLRTTVGIRLVVGAFNGKMIRENLCDTSDCEYGKFAKRIFRRNKFYFTRRPSPHETVEYEWEKWHGVKCKIVFMKENNRSRFCRKAFDSMATLIRDRDCRHKDEILSQFSAPFKANKFFSSAFSSAAASYQDCRH